MDIHINESELTLLTYLHENRRGYGEKFPLDTSATMVSDTSLSDTDFELAISYLDEHRLAGMEARSVVDRNGKSETIIGYIWITGLGEDYMRALENDPKIGKKITMSVLKEARVVIVATAGSVLAEFFKRFIAPH